jgi:dCMP deaminase
MLKTNPDTWDNRFMALALQARSWTKGEGPGVGVCLVSPDKKSFSLGYSGFPHGMDDTPVALRDVATRDAFTLHAEVNAIINAGRNLNGWWLFSTKAPCSVCAAAIVQAGVSRVIAPKPENSSRWLTSCLNGDSLFKYTGVHRKYLELEDCKCG